MALKIRWIASLTFLIVFFFNVNWFVWFFYFHFYSLTKGDEILLDGVRYKLDSGWVISGFKDGIYDLIDYSHSGMFFHIGNKYTLNSGVKEYFSSLSLVHYPPCGDVYRSEDGMNLAYYENISRAVMFDDESADGVIELCEWFNHIEEYKISG
ncbi:hypothetical protein [Corallincola spongiicola]|uniref:Uncharacterized protein n=1 Tax=Corallincola spongiicola TaxID=2520508 RepID=A0ABY1WRB2_9GAMM|nr:hypothetical protein [Corallincola spongiicola]TAA47262.1 hypothetical protein EXY25_08485 [Corallincola spongiicola]